MIRAQNAHRSVSALPLMVFFALAPLLAGNSSLVLLNP
jgi:hypothetical protein